MLTLEDYILSQPPAGPTLPAVRVDTSKTVRLVLTSGVIREKEPICDVYHQSILYFNYGRPAYRPPSDNLPNNIKNKAPICLVADISKMPSPIRMAAIDTGGMPYYDELKNAKYVADDFLLPAVDDAPQRAVTGLFGTNRKYLSGQPLANLRSKELSLEVLALHKHLKGGAVRAADDRASAIELQYEDKIVTKKGLLIGIVVPDLYAGDKEFIAWTKRNKITAEFYTYIRDWRDGERYGMMTASLIGIYKKRGILK